MTLAFPCFRNARLWCSNGRALWYSEKHIMEMPKTEVTFNQAPGYILTKLRTKNLITKITVQDQVCSSCSGVIFLISRLDIRGKVNFHEPIFSSKHLVVQSNNGNYRTTCEICSKLIIKTEEARNEVHGVFVINSEQISQATLVFHCWRLISKRQVSWAC